MDVVKYIIYIILYIYYMYNNATLSSSSVEELKTLTSGTMPKTSHHRSPGGERRGKRKRSTVFLERARESHRQSDENRNCFKGNIGETSERRGRMHTGLFRAHCSHLELNELN